MYDGRILICLIHNQNLKDLGFCQKIPHLKIFLVPLHHHQRSSSAEASDEMSKATGVCTLHHSSLPRALMNVER